MGIFHKLFSGKELQFQKQVLNFLRSRVIDVSASSDPLSIRLNGVELGLRELHKQCLANSVQTSEIIEQYFSFPIAFCVGDNYSWNEVESRIRPQLVPVEIAQKFEIQLFPFQQQIASCVVIKDEQRQIYVRKRRLTEWNVSPEEVFNRAVVNLDSDPVEMEVTITDGSDRFIGLETHDGFDAARILLPRVRDFAAGKLGLPFLAGIPNLDFLILWSNACSPRFQEYAAEKIETDFSIQPFPLTTAVFEIDTESIKEREERRL